MVALPGLNDPFLPHDSTQSTISHSQQSSIYSRAYIEGSDPFCPFGFLKGSRFSRNESDLDKFLSQDGVKLQPITRGIAERYGYAKAALAKKGTPIPENDIWIAATALETGTRLVSNDAHFDFVGGLLRMKV